MDGKEVVPVFVDKTVEKPGIIIFVKIRARRRIQAITV
jgi:hypothetical protein